MLEDVTQEFPDAPKFRWERCDWPRDMRFDAPEPVILDPFPGLRPVFCEFRGYESEDIARVKIPPKSGNRPSRAWLDVEEGEYYVHEGYLCPQ